MDQQPVTKITLIKTVYFFLVSFVALMMIIFSTADLINTVLRTYVFTKADNFSGFYPEQVCVAKPDGKAMTTEECAQQNTINEKRDKASQESQRQRDLVRDLSMILVGVPVFVLHWRVARKKE